VLAGDLSDGLFGVFHPVGSGLQRTEVPSQFVLGTLPLYSGSDLQKVGTSESLTDRAYRVSDQVLVVQSHGQAPEDSFLVLPEDSWDPALAGHLRVTMRISPSSGPQETVGRFFWSTTWSPFRDASPVAFSVHADGAWHSYVVPVAHLRDWWSMGIGKQLRLNPFYGQGPARIEVRELGMGPGVPAPRIRWSTAATASPLFASVSVREGTPVLFEYTSASAPAQALALEVSRFLFREEALPTKTTTVELTMPLNDLKGEGSIDLAHLGAPGIRYVRLVSLDGQGQVNAPASAAIRLSVSP
jgi:hypothetical protein